ncbi:hypothetical protein QQP08_003700 [Theobroma cacao]|nr:hypothetical protein QQP08_003700 [Theobroma cacao]
MCFPVTHCQSYVGFRNPLPIVCNLPLTHYHIPNPNRPTSLSPSLSCFCPKLPSFHSLSLSSAFLLNLTSFSDESSSILPSPCLSDVSQTLGIETISVIFLYEPVDPLDLVNSIAKDLRLGS